MKKLLQDENINININIYQKEADLRSLGYQRIAGFDEVGRGPLAGPMLTCGVILKPGVIILGINDSKKLTEKKREELYPKIIEAAEDIALYYISPQDVDKYNPYRSSQIGMEECAKALHCDYALTDAMPFVDIDIPYEAFIKGDAKIAAISCASIIAKVMRDHCMVALDSVYPGYDFKKHKGYGTKVHLEALHRLGPCPIHRFSYEPVRSEDNLRKENQLL